MEIREQERERRRKMTKKKMVALISILNQFHLRIEQIDDPYLTSLRGGYIDDLILYFAGEIINIVKR